MLEECKNCKYYRKGQTEEQRRKWNRTNFEIWSDGICNKKFPKRYGKSEPPYPARAAGHCFQWEEKDNQIEINYNV